MKYNFDPDNIYTIPYIAKQVGVTITSVISFMRRRPELPEPLFTLDLRNGKTLPIWSAEDGENIVRIYKEFRDK